MPLRADERAGRILAPRIFATGQAITYPGSHGDRISLGITDFEKDKALLDAHIAEQHFAEAASLVADFAFKNIGVHRLEARAVIENGRGNRALEKLGAKGEAVLRKSFGKDYSQFLWAIVADEWRPPAPADATAFDAAKLKRDIARAIAATPVAQVVTPSASEPFPFFLTDAAGSADED